MSDRQQAEAEIQVRYESLQGTLTERSRRLFAGSEALAFGRLFRYRFIRMSTVITDR